MTLNNPKGLNALNKAMIDIMQPQLQVGKNSRQCRRYILLTLSWYSSAIRKVTFLQPRHSERRRQRLLCGRRCQRSAAEGVAEAGALLLDGDEVTDIAHDTALVRSVQKEETRQEAVDFFRDEYTLDREIALMKKPVISFMDGATSKSEACTIYRSLSDTCFAVAVGGGVGISVHAPFRIATENTVFAMPEVNSQYSIHCHRR